ncbi:hypothetical protein CPC08DRAFT_769783 [Agrocybe pediades]|nr:hypothetical protein CPC08DRAFT_769783 [Agrocybe pediades]
MSNITATVSQAAKRRRETGKSGKAAVKTVGPWEDLSNHSKDFEILANFISEVNNTLMERDGNYPRYQVLDGASAEGAPLLRRLVEHYQEIGILPNLGARFTPTEWLRHSFFTDLLGSIAYSMQYHEPGNIEGGIISMRDALINFIDAMPISPPFHLALPAALSHIRPSA